MAEEQTSFESLKAFPGFVHRQPLFTTDRLDVDSYHLTFLDAHGNKLNDDAKVPPFIDQLPTILSIISDRQKALLSIPESWQNALQDLPESDIDLTLDISDLTNSVADNKSRFAFATRAEFIKENDSPDVLLIDLQQIDYATLIERLPYWRENHKILCAINVNDLEQYTFCSLNSLDLIQGQFYTLPAANNNQKTSPSTQTLMELLVKLQDPEIEPEDLAVTINQDISLSYELLRLINSVFFGLPREVNNTKEAIVILGQSKIKTWASLLILFGIDEKPNELRIIAMARARMCELLAKHYKGKAEMFFAAGLFSTLDALLDRPIDSIISKLPLSPELKEALLNKSGALGQALNDVLSYEKGDWVAISDSPVSTEILTNTYLDAIHWAKELNQQLQD